MRPLELLLLCLIQRLWPAQRPKGLVRPMVEWGGDHLRPSVKYVEEKIKQYKYLAY